MSNRSIVLTLCIVGAVALTKVDAAPPVGGVPSLEERVVAGCQFAELVIIAKITGLRDVVKNDRVWQIGSLDAIEVLKGAAKEVPHDYSLPKRIPMMSDQMGIELEEGMVYLMFLKAPRAPGRETAIPKLEFDSDSNRKTDRYFRSATDLARKACKR